MLAVTNGLYLALGPSDKDVSMFSRGMYKFKLGNKVAVWLLLIESHWIVFTMEQSL